MLEISDAIEMLIPFPNNDIQQITQCKEINIIWKAQFDSGSSRVVIEFVLLAAAISHLTSCKTPLD
jgi:hypothetical protein